MRWICARAFACQRMTSAAVVAVGVDAQPDRARLAPRRAARRQVQALRRQPSGAASRSRVTGGFHQSNVEQPAFFLSARASGRQRAHQPPPVHHGPNDRPPASRRQDTSGDRRLVYPDDGPTTRRSWRGCSTRATSTPNRWPRSTREIWRRFGRTRAVLVLDMCGFSRLTMRYGITHFLAMIRRLRTHRPARDRGRRRPRRQDRGRQRVRDVRRRPAGARRRARDPAQPGRRQHLPARGLGPARRHRHRLRAAAAGRRATTCSARR